MARHFLAYATTNASRLFLRDAENVHRLAAQDAGVGCVEVYIAVSEVVPRRPADDIAFASLRRVLERNPRLQTCDIKFTAGAEGRLGAWSWCLSRIAKQCGPEDYVLCADRAARGPLRDGWYGELVRQYERRARMGICSDALLPADRLAAHVFLGKARELLEHLPGAAGGRATGERGEEAASFLQGCASFAPRGHAGHLPSGAALRWSLTQLVCRARSALILGTSRVLLRAFHTRVRSLRLSAQPATFDPMPRGTYLLEVRAGGSSTWCLSPGRDSADGMSFLATPGRSVFLVALRCTLRAPTFLVPGSEAALAAPVSMAVLRLPWVLGKLMSVLCEVAHRPRFAIGHYDRLTPAPVDAVSRPWWQWLECLPLLSALGIADVTPDSPAMAPPRSPAPRQGSVGGAAPGARVGVHLHLFYPDLWEEMSACLANLPGGFGLQVTAARRDEALFREIRTRYPGAEITLVENRGRDIAPFLLLLNAGRFDRFDYVCKLHTKKSLQNGRETYLGCAWRRRALADLAGSAATVARIVALFDGQPDLGLVGPGALRFPRTPGVDALGRNRRAMQALMERALAEDRRGPIVFFAGSMFWFRPKALERVRRLDIGLREFPPEEGQRDGTLAHALERLIPSSVLWCGYQVAGVPAAPTSRIEETRLSGTAAMRVES